MYKEENSKDKYITKGIEKNNKTDRGSVKEKENISPTIKSFEDSGGIITDNEYEVKSEIDVGNDNIILNNNYRE